jgi:hypothetical protein
MALLRSAGARRVRIAPLIALLFQQTKVCRGRTRLVRLRAARVKNSQAVVFPLSEKTHGHQTHTWADLWKTYLTKLLLRSKR